jgi:polysaccharide deacetylase 2 family uncharacterized protein YibQ
LRPQDRHEGRGKGLTMAIPRSIRRLAKEASRHVRAVFGSVGTVRFAVLSVVGLVAILVIAIETLGDPAAAGPRRVVSLSGPGGAEAAPVVSFSEAVARGEDMGGPVDGSGESAPAPRSRPLARAPIAGLAERGPLGPLPIVARDGRTPALAYAKPYPADRRPKIALVVGGLGINARNTVQAIDELPGEVTLSFLPYARNLQMWINRARARGHEVMLELPMESFDPGADDTGPQVLLAQGSRAQNVQRLENLMSRGAGYFGVTNYQGARFAGSAQASAAVVEQIKRRGLVFLSNGIGPRTAFAFEAARVGLPMASADRIFDARGDAEAVSEQLVALEAIALQKGSAIGAGFGYPVTMEQIASWSGALRRRGLALAPASAVIQARMQR